MALSDHVELSEFILSEAIFEIRKDGKIEPNERELFVKLFRYLGIGTLRYSEIDGEVRRKIGEPDPAAGGFDHESFASRIYEEMKPFLSVEEISSLMTDIGELIGVSLLDFLQLEAVELEEVQSNLEITLRDLGSLNESVRQEVERLAELGDHLALEYMSIIYFNGFGVERSAEKSFELCLSAANEGNRRAMVALANKFLLGQGTEEDEDQARKWFLKAAQAGSVLAMNNLAIQQINGDEQEQARRWLENASGYLLPQAIQSLAAYLEDTSLDIANPRQALSYHILGSALDYSRSLYDLGLSYYTGDLVTADLDTAIHLFQRSAQRGYGDAFYNLGVIYHQEESLHSPELALGHLLAARRLGVEDMDDPIRDLFEASSPEIQEAGKLHEERLMQQVVQENEDPLSLYDLDARFEISLPAKALEGLQLFLDCQAAGNLEPLAQIVSPDLMDRLKNSGNGLEWLENHYYRMDEGGYQVKFPRLSGKIFHHESDEYEVYSLTLKIDAKQSSTSEGTSLYSELFFARHLSGVNWVFLDTSFALLLEKKEWFGLDLSSRQPFRMTPSGERLTGLGF